MRNKCSALPAFPDMADLSEVLVDEHNKSYEQLLMCPMCKRLDCHIIDSNRDGLDDSSLGKPYIDIEFKCGFCDGLFILIVHQVSDGVSVSLSAFKMVGVSQALGQQFDDRVEESDAPSKTRQSVAPDATA